MWNFKGTLWNSTQNILLIHWKIRFLYNIGILRALRFKSSYAFLKRPPARLLCHVQTFVVISYIDFRWKQNEFSIESELQWKESVTWIPGFIMNSLFWSSPLILNLFTVKCSHLSPGLHGVADGGDGAGNNASELANKISKETFLKKLNIMLNKPSIMNEMKSFTTYYFKYLRWVYINEI